MQLSLVLSVAVTRIFDAICEYCSGTFAAIYYNFPCTWPPTNADMIADTAAAAAAAIADEHRHFRGEGEPDQRPSGHDAQGAERTAGLGPGQKREPRRDPVQSAAQARQHHRRQFPELRPVRLAVRHPDRGRVRILLAVSRRAEEVPLAPHRIVNGPPGPSKRAPAITCGRSAQTGLWLVAMAHITSIYRIETLFQAVAVAECPLHLPMRICGVHIFQDNFPR